MVRVRRLVRADSGAVAVVVALFAVAVFIFGALVVEVGAAREVRREAQNAADAAALAAAGELYDARGRLRPQEAIQAAKRFARENFDTGRASSTYWNGCAAPRESRQWRTRINGFRTGTSCIAFYREGSRWTKVQVAVPGKDTPGFFGAVSGDVRALAQAAIEPSSSFSCVVCVLNDWDGQNGDALVTNGGVAINGDVSTQPNGSIAAMSIGVAGSGLPDDNLSPAGVPIPNFADPLSSLPLPPIPLGATASDGSGNCAPGNYIRILDCTSFQSGVYVIVGDNTLSGLQGLDANPVGGVLFYFTCSTTTGRGASQQTTTRPCRAGESGGRIEATGQGEVTITGRSYSGRRFAVIYDRNNTALLRLRGNGATSISGDIYAASAAFDARGNGAFALDSLVVTSSISFAGNPAALEVNYTGSPVTIPGPPGEPGLIK